jgi:hypothetical protein
MLSRSFVAKRCGDLHGHDDVPLVRIHSRRDVIVHVLQKVPPEPGSVHLKASFSESLRSKVEELLSHTAKPGAARRRQATSGGKDGVASQGIIATRIW